MIVRLEHFALNLPSASEAAEWYVNALGMSIVRQSDDNDVRFLADSTGRTVLEIYSNKQAPVLPRSHTRTIHLAFEVENVDRSAHRLAHLGAVVEESPETLESGDRLAMLRDPWGTPVQLLQRAKPLP